MNKPAKEDTQLDQQSTSNQLFNLIRERMGWTDEYIAAIENPNYPELKDLDRIIAALHQSQQSGSKVVVMPDFDMDGISSGVLGYAGLKELGFNVELYTPDYNRGHDISPDAIDELVTRHPDVETIITCDSGVNSHEGIQRGREHGLTMLVTDHHVQLPTNTDGSATSPAHVIINPERLDETYTMRSYPLSDGTKTPHRAAICGAFVLYQVLIAYTKVHAPEKLAHMEMLKLFAGLGTVSDVMPLQYENRQLVRDSLSQARLLLHYLPDADLATKYEVDKSILMRLLNSRSHELAPEFTRAFRGFAYVLQTWREAGSLSISRGLAADFYGFYVAPAFNALRRIGAPMQVAFDVFTADTPEKQYAAAQQIIEYNNERIEQVENWIEEIESRDQPFAPHVWFSAAPSGMLGLLAGKLMSQSQVPTVVVHAPETVDPTSSSQVFAGSARAPMWFQIIATLTTHGYTAIGHEQACGIRADSLTELSEIAELLGTESDRLLAQMELQRTGEDAQLEYDLAMGIGIASATTPDSNLPDPDTLLEIARRVDAFAPFGHEFARPTVRFIVDLGLCAISVLGKDETHLKIALPNGIKLLYWNSAQMLPELQERSDQLFIENRVTEFDTDVSINRFMGEESPQAVVHAIHFPEGT